MSNKQRGVKRPVVSKKHEKGQNRNNLKSRNNDILAVNKLHVYLEVGTKSFEEQVDSVIAQTDMTAERRMDIDKTVRDVGGIFISHFPDVEPVVFGSVLANTAFKNSDVDIHLRFRKGQPAGNFIRDHGNLIHKEGRFTNIHKIQTARVPIVKAEHKATRVNIDISCQQENFGIINSLLVRHLCSVDPRVKKLIQLIIIWSKFHGLNPYRFSSFTFTLLVLFYLQVVKILPPLHKIIKVTAEGVWPTNFHHDPALLSNDNTESMSSLFLGLFTFYSAVHFDEVILSTFAGEIILVSMLKNPELMPEYFHPWKSLLSDQFSFNEHINVQEPFNLSHNTTRNATANHIDLLKRGCLKVCDVFSKFCLNQCLEIIFSNVFSLYSDKDIFTWTLSCPDNKDPQTWRSECAEAITQVFSKILLMDILHYDQYAQNHNFAQFHIIRDKSLNSLPDMTFVATTKYNVCTKDRAKMYKLFSKSNASDFEKEVKTSKLLLEDVKKTEVNFRALICVHTHAKNNSTQAVFINQIRGANIFQQIITFLKGGRLVEFIRFYLIMKSSADANTFVNKRDVREITSGISCSSLNDPKVSFSCPQTSNKLRAEVKASTSDVTDTNPASTDIRSLPVTEMIHHLKEYNSTRREMNLQGRGVSSPHSGTSSTSVDSPSSSSHRNLTVRQSSDTSNSFPRQPVPQLLSQATSRNDQNHVGSNSRRPFQRRYFKRRKR